MLSYQKHIVTICLAFAIVVIAAALCCTTLGTAAANDEYQLSITGLSSQTGLQYGDVLNASVDENGRIYGNLSSNYVFKVGEGNTYYIKASDIFACTRSTAPGEGYTPKTSQLCDAKGRVKQDVLGNYDPLDTATSRYYLTYEDISGYWFFSPLQLYIAATDLPYTGYKVAKSNDLLYTQIVPRQITVAYQPDASHIGTGMGGDALVTEEVDGVLYIRHTYGAPRDTIAFAAEGTAVMTDFGDVLTTSGDIVGNDDVSHAGYHKIESLDLVVKRDETVVSNNYNIVSARQGLDATGSTGYGVRVMPRVVEVGSFVKDSYFATEMGALDSLFDGAHHFSTQGFARVLIGTGVDGQTVTAYFDVDEDQEDLWDIGVNGPREGVVAIRTEGDGWSAHIVDWIVTNDDPLSDYETSAADYDIRPAAGAFFGVRVSARSIVLYDSSQPGGEAGSEGEWVDVVTNHIAISLPYGTLYDGEEEEYTLLIGGTSVKLTFEVQYEGQALKDYLAANEREYIRLPAGTYQIINPKVTDKHYNVNVHESVRWQVTKRVVGYDQLTAWGLGASQYTAAQKGTAQQKAMYAYLSANATHAQGICIGEYAYDATRNMFYQVYQFEDGELSCDVSGMVSTAAKLPGYYPVTYVNADYEVEEGVLWLRILPVTVSVVLPTDVVYDGGSHTASLRYGGEEENPFAEAGWSVAISYRVGTRAIDAPTDAGTYTVAVTITPAGSPNPYLVYNEANERFAIARKPITVRLTNTAKLSKTYAESIQPNARWFDAEGLCGRDSVTLTSSGFDAAAVPKTYAIDIAIASGNGDNYQFTLVGKDDKTPSFTVNKLTADAALTYFGDLLANDEITQIGTDGLQMRALQYRGQAIGDVNYMIAGGDANWQHIEGNRATGLKDGTKYTVRIVLRAGGRYVDTDVDRYTDSREAVTNIAAPVPEQDVTITSGGAVVLRITNFDSAKTYQCIAYAGSAATALSSEVILRKAAIVTPDENGELSVARYYTAAKNEDDWLLSEDMSEMQNESAYYVIVVSKTLDYAVFSEPYEVRTRAAAPAINSSSLRVSTTGITVPRNYYIYVRKIDYSGALPVAAVVPSSMKETGITYEMLANAGATLASDYIEATAQNLEPNTAYALAIWDVDEYGMPSDVQCYTFKTRIDQTNRFRYSGFMLYVSKYLLIGLLALNLLFLVICAARYAALKKKLGR